MVDRIRRKQWALVLTALSFFDKAGVFCRHEVLEFLPFIVGDGWLHVVVVIVFEELRKQVVYLFSFGATEGEGGCVDVFGQQLVEETVALTIATYDTASLPEADGVKELAAWESYFANEQLVEVVGG